MKIRYFLPLILTAILGVILWAGLHSDPHHLPSALINQPTPQFALRALSEGVMTQKDLRGKVSLFNVWATWCTACREEHETLMKISEENFVPIYGMAYQDDWNSAKQWLQTYGDPYQKVGFDREGRVAMDWGVYGAPETFVIDKKGVIRSKHLGPLTLNDWNNTIKPLISQLQNE